MLTTSGLFSVWGHYKHSRYAHWCRVSVCTCAFLSCRYTSRCRVVGSYGRCMFNFSTKCQTVFQTHSGNGSFHIPRPPLPPAVSESSNPSTSLRIPRWSVFLIVAIQNEGYLIMVLISNSLMTNDGKSKPTF